MYIKIATTEEEIQNCFPVMQQLRPHLDEDQFVSRIRAQEETGYRLVYLRDADQIMAVAGFRVGENLAWGRFMYVDDLVTLPESRSSGYGARLISWLKDHARGEECFQLHLDSGLQRKDAHRFYEREGVQVSGYHFFAEL